MINPNNLKALSDNLEDIIGTPVSEKILENCTEAQRGFLTKLMYDFTQGHDVDATIRSILDYGKSKLKTREYSDKTKHYLEDKLK